MNTPQPQVLTPDTLLVVKLEAQHWNIVMAGLGELPYRHSAPVIQALMEQINAQTPTGNGVDISQSPYKEPTHDAA